MDEIVLLAGCIILDDYGRLLLLHRSTDNPGQWELPGGKVEEEESPEQAAVREIREELGIVVRLERALGNDLFEEQGISYQFHWFLATVMQGKLQLMEANLFDDFDYIDLEDLPSLALSPNMQLLEQKILSGEVSLEP